VLDWYSVSAFSPSDDFRYSTFTCKTFAEPSRADSCAEEGIYIFIAIIFSIYDHFSSFHAAGRNKKHAALTRLGDSVVLLSATVATVATLVLSRANVETSPLAKECTFDLGNCYAPDLTGKYS
jgi:hypothetical protein